MNACSLADISFKKMLATMPPTKCLSQWTPFIMKVGKVKWNKSITHFSAHNVDTVNLATMMVLYFMITF